MNPARRTIDGPDTRGGDCFKNKAPKRRMKKMKRLSISEYKIMRTYRKMQIIEIDDTSVLVRFLF